MRSRQVHYNKQNQKYGIGSIQTYNMKSGCANEHQKNKLAWLLIAFIHKKICSEHVTLIKQHCELDVYTVKRLES